MANLAPWTWGRKNLPTKQEEHPAYSLQRDMNKLFEDFYRSFDMPNFFISEQDFNAFSPRLDVKETEKEIVVSAELPGLEEDDVQVSLHNDLLTIAGEKREEKEENVKGHYRMERSYGSFSRTLPMPSEIDSENVVAEFKKGVLTVKLPKTTNVKTQKTIPIKKS